MPRTAHEGSCEHCQARFSFELVHNGLNGSAYAYCDRCGTTALLDAASARPEVRGHRAIDEDDEPLLSPCPCGGSFSSSATPRCPECRAALDPLIATDYIERAVRPVAAGWKWQRDWSGLYCLVVERRVAHNPWEGNDGRRA